MIEAFVLMIDGLKIDIDPGNWQNNSEKKIVPIYMDQIEYEDMGHS